MLILQTNLPLLPLLPLLSFLFSLFYLSLPQLHLPLLKPLVPLPLFFLFLVYLFHLFLFFLFLLFLLFLSQNASHLLCNFSYLLLFLPLLLQYSTFSRLSSILLDYDLYCLCNPLSLLSFYLQLNHCLVYQFRYFHLLYCRYCSNYNLSHYDRSRIE